MTASITSGKARVLEQLEPPKSLVLLFACAVALLLVFGLPVVRAQVVAGNSTQTTSGGNLTQTTSGGNLTQTTSGGFSVRPASFDLGSAAVAILVLVLLGLAAALALIARWMAPGSRRQG